MLATDDLDGIIALRPDCVHYAPLHPDVDDLCRLLSAGINVVTPVGFVYPIPSQAAEFARLDEACEQGNSSLHGTGVHPGFSGDLLALTFARIQTRIDQIQVREVADFRLHPSKAMQEALGFGRDPRGCRTKSRPAGEDDGAYLRAVDDHGGRGPRAHRRPVHHGIRRRQDQARPARALGRVPAGTVGGMRFEWTAWSDDQPLVVFRTFWKMDDDLDPDWGYGSIKYSLRIEGDPSIELNFESAHKHPDGDEGYWGRVWTAMNGINTIPTVCAAPAGVLTHLDLPFVRPEGLLRPRSATFGEPIGR